MNHSPESDQFGASNQSVRSVTSEGLVFDDEPLESLLDPDLAVAPTSANAFEPARQLLQQFGSAAELQTEAGFKKFADLIESGAAIPKALFDTLVMLAKGVLPRWPNPPSPETPPSVGRLLNGLWEYSKQTKHLDGQIVAGSPLWEYFELQHDYQRAAAILKDIYSLQKEKGNYSTLPTLSNNLAYQYFLNRDWEAAAKEFETATRLALKCKDESGVANAKLNYWLSRIEGGDIASPKTVLEEFDSLMTILRQHDMPMAHRKIFVYTAKLKAMLGDRQSAVESMQRAVEIDRQYRTIFLNEDEQLLNDYSHGE